METGSGLIGSVKRLASTLASIISTRLELLANELQEERLRLTQMLLLGLFALFCAGMGVLLLVLFIVVLFGDEHRLAALGVLCVLFFSLAAVLALLLRSKAQTGSKLFSASLAELAKDKQELGDGREQTTD